MTRQLAADILWVSAAVVLCAAVYFYHSYSKDSRALRRLATRLTAGSTRADERVRVLNSFVYGHGSFDRNASYFVLPSLRATPMQVLDRGGDCSDKSRLLAAMLEQIGIKASLAMLYGCAGCPAVHTVVLARTESGTIVADPVYDLMFPNGAGGYHDVHRMIDDPRVLTSRLGALRASRGPADRIADYDESDHRYDFVTTINWAKYGWLRGLARGLTKLALEPRLIRRPALLENPKLLLASLSGIGAALAAVLALACRRSGV